MLRRNRGATVAGLSDSSLRLWVDRRWCGAVIPVRDQDPDRLVRAIASTLAQPEAVGVLVVDGGSAPGPCRDRVDALPFMFPGGRVNVVRTLGRSGRDAAVEAGCREALDLWPSVGLVAVVDSGTVLGEGALAEAALQVYAFDDAGSAVAYGQGRRLADRVGRRVAPLVLWRRAVLFELVGDPRGLDRAARVEGWRRVQASRASCSRPFRPDGVWRDDEGAPTFWIETGARAGVAVEVSSPMVELRRRKGRRP